MREAEEATFVRARRAAAAVGLGALALTAAGGILAGVETLARAWLIAVVLWVGIPVGCLAIALIHQLAGGQWGAAIERPLEAAARTLPWLALAILPLFLWLPHLYEWARPSAAADPRLAHKALYLNPPFFAARTVVYFAVWTALAVLLDRWSIRRDRTADPRLTIRLRGLAAGGLVALGFTVSFAAIDWLMSLEATWYSTVFGAMVGMGWILNGFAFVVAIVLLGAEAGPLAPLLTDKVRIDLGNLLLTFVVLWTYLAFVQLLIIWSGNIPEEVRWYVHRLDGGWGALAAFLGAGRFLLPLFVLLSRAAKRRPGVMASLAIWLVFTEWVNAVWLVLPAFAPERIAVHWLDATASLALGGLWMALFFTLLGQRPLVAWQDPALPMPEIQHAA
jgi:hypothetical protein